MKDTAEATLARECIERRARVGDGGEAVAVGRLLPEVGEQRVRLDRPAALAGGNEERAPRIEPRIEREQLLGVSRVGHVQVQAPGGGPERGMQHLGGETRAAHTHEHDIGAAFGGEILCERRQPPGLPANARGCVEKPETVTDLGGIGLPDGVITPPEAGHDRVAAQRRQAFLDGPREVAERTRGGGGGGRAQSRDGGRVSP